MYNMLRTQAVSSVLIAMMLASCVPQDGIIVSIPTATKEPVPITETVDIPTATEVPATEVPTSTPTPIPTETPEPTPTATKWPPAGPYNVNLKDHEFLTFGHRLLFYKYEDSTEHFPEALDVIFKDFYFESLEVTDEGYFLVGSLVAQDRANKGESYPVRIKVKTDMFVQYREKNVFTTTSGEEFVEKDIDEGNYIFFACNIMEKDKEKPLVKEGLQDDKGIIDQEKWRELRLLVGDLLVGGGETEDYELVFNAMDIYY